MEFLKTSQWTSGNALQ